MYETSDYAYGVASHSKLFLIVEEIPSNIIDDFNIPGFMMITAHYKHTVTS